MCTLKKRKQSQQKRLRKKKNPFWVTHGKGPRWNRNELPIRH